MKHRSPALCLVFFGLLLIARTVAAADYYIDQAHSSASDSNPGTAALPWKTITKANQALSAGDTVYIKSGTYTNYISPTRSGTSSSPITYKNFGGDTVTVQSTSYAISLVGKSYITVQGITFTNVDRFMYLEGASNHNVIAFNRFTNTRNATAEWAGSRIWEGSSYNWVHDNVFGDYGECTSSGSDDGSVFEIGFDDGDASQAGNYNLVENNVMYHGGHHVIGVNGNHNIIRNNYFYNYNWTRNHGNRNLYLNGRASYSNRNLIEGNRIGYSDKPCDAFGAPGVRSQRNSTSFAGTRSFTTILAACSSRSLTTTGPVPTITGCTATPSWTMGGRLTADRMISSAARLHSTIGRLRSLSRATRSKTICTYDAPRVYGYNSTTANDQIFAGNYNGDASGNPKFVNATTTPGDPTDTSYPDLHLQSTSPAIDVGAPLTVIVSAGGTGTSFQLSDASYFMDGWGLIPGDEIQLVGTAQRARITAVNYSTNTVTLDRSVTWTQNQGVGLPYEGTSPDAGAYEFGSSSAPSAPRNLRITI